MGIKRKINKYVDEIQIPEANKVLPEGIKKAESETKTSSRRWIYQASGFALAAAVLVAGVGIVPKIAKESVKNSGSSTAVESSNTSGSIKDDTSKKPSKEKGDKPSKDKEFSDGMIKGDSLNGFSKGDMIADDFLEFPSDSIESSTSVVKPEMGISGEYTDDDSYYGWDDIYEGYVDNAVAGTLTGGELRDNLNWDNYKRNISSATLGEWFVLSNTRISVNLSNGEAPLYGVKVALVDNDDNVIYSAVTDIKGDAYLFYNYNGQSEEPTKLRVYDGDSSNDYDLSQNLNSKNEMELVIEGSNKDIALDLMFVVDTTGSMGDELSYLQAEIQNVIERASDETGVSIRTSVNFYRDQTDEYVVKYYDFRDDAEEVSKLIADEYADGGGDYPEAVKEAFDNAINEHSWNEDSIKLMFVVLDAPPHDDDAKELSELVCQAAKEGIRIIPIMSSGADKETEAIFRSYAVMTGGTYVFLDDNSGIGGSHQTPVTPEEYTSEYLNDMIIRIIGEYVGTEISGTIVDLPEDPIQGN